MAAPASPQGSRRFALIVGALVLVLLVVVLLTLPTMCNEPDDEAIEYVSPEEELGPAPGVE